MNRLLGIVFDWFLLGCCVVVVAIVLNLFITGGGQTLTIPFLF